MPGVGVGGGRRRLTGRGGGCQGRVNFCIMRYLVRDTMPDPCLVDIM